MERTLAASPQVAPEQLVPQDSCGFAAEEPQTARVCDASHSKHAGKSRCRRGSGSQFDSGVEALRVANFSGSYLQESGSSEENAASRDFVPGFVTKTPIAA